MISPDAIELSSIEPEILELFAPLLCEMDDLKKTLDFE